MTDTDRATDRLAEALEKLRTSDQHITGVPMFSEVLMETLIQYLTAQGFGHQSDILRAFTEWLDKIQTHDPDEMSILHYPSMADAYLRERSTE